MPANHTLASMNETTVTHSFTPVDNDRLARLCGALDENLKQIETGLDVGIQGRGEQFTLRGEQADAALQLLSLFQREARLIDFTQENLSGYSDADIGAAARVVHEGCSKVLREHFTIEPVRSEAEGSRIVLEAGFDAAAVRLTGNVVGQAPFRGALSHRGWRAASVRLPKLAEAHDAAILAPAEVEL